MKKELRKIGVVGHGKLNHAIHKALSTVPGEAPKQVEQLAPKKKVQVNALGFMRSGTVTPERANRIFYSLQCMALMSEVIKIEYAHEMDVDFRDPLLNNLSNRIGKDCLEVLERLRKNPRVQLSNLDTEFSEEYASEIHRVNRFFIGRDIEKIRELMDGWDKVSKHIEETGGEDNYTYLTIGFTPEELLEFESLGKRKGVSEGLSKKFEASIREAKK